MSDLLILTPWFPNKPDGWPARYISDSALALAEMGHQVRVGVVRGFVPYGMSRWASEEHRGHVDVEAFDLIEDIREARYFALPNGLMYKAKNRSIDWTVRALLDEFVAERRPDIVLVHTETIAPSAVQAAHKHGLPVTVTLHGENTNPFYLDPPSQKNRFRLGLSAADRLLVVGTPLIPYAAGLSGRDDNIEVVWNGVTPPDTQRRVPEPDVDPVELVTVANLQEGKGVDLLLQALAQLNAEGVKDWRLRIVGRGPMANELQKFSEQTGLSEQVSFLGLLSNTEVFNVLAEGDIFVLPSYREAFGVAYLEAMASGLLTIGVTGQGPEQFIEDGKTGLLITPRSVDSVSSCLRQILTGDRRQWRKIAAQGANFVRTEMTWAAHARRLTSIAEGILNNDQPVVQPHFEQPEVGGALAIFIEPTPYIRKLDFELKKQWGAPVKTWVISQAVSQNWQSVAEFDDLEILPARKVYSLYSLWRDMRRQRPEVVFVAGWSHPIIVAAIVMGRLAGARIVSFSDTWSSASTGTRDWVKRKVLGLIDRFAPGGTRQAKYLRDLGVPVQKIFTANMTVDTKAMRAYYAQLSAEERSAVRHALGIENRGLVFLFVGRLEPVKGLDLLLDAFAALDKELESRLVIVGDGALRPLVEEAVARDNRIFYQGRLEGQALWAQFAAADVLVAPSRVEPWGLVVNEALTAGLAIVLSDAFGCIDDLIRPEENALLIPVEDPTALSSALRRLALDPDLLQRLRDNAGQSVADWTTEAWAANILAAWRDALSNKSSSWNKV